MSTPLSNPKPRERRQGSRLQRLPLASCLVALCLCQACQAPTAGRLAWTNEVGARRLPERTTVFNVTDYGAKGDGATLETKMIQAAIDACSAHGGGRVTFQPGNYLTGSLFVKSGVTLQIDQEVQLLGSQNIEDYPEMDSRIAGIEMKWPAALINVIGQDNVAITGDGTVHAQGKPFWDQYWALRREYEPKGIRWAADYDSKRPRTVLVAASRDVTLRGLTLKQAGFWTIHVLYSSYVTCDGLVIQNNVDGSGPSTDGIDIDSSSYVLVENCDIDCNDDNFCLKSGRDWDGLRVNRPTEYVVIRDCISRRGGGLVSFGSETSGGIRHVLAHRLQARGTGVGLRFKSARTRGGVVENIDIEDIDMNGVRTAIEVSADWNPSYSYTSLPEGFDPSAVPAHWKTMLRAVEPPERGIPQFRNVRISRVRVTEAGTALSVSGTGQSIVKNFSLDDVRIDAQSAGRISHASGWTFKDVILNTKDSSALRLQNSTEMDVDTRSRPD